MQRKVHDFHDFRLYLVHFTAATTANSTFGILFNTLQDPPLIHMLRTLRNRATSCSLAAVCFIAKRIRLAWHCTRSSIKLKSGPITSLISKWLQTSHLCTTQLPS